MVIKVCVSSNQNSKDSLLLSIVLILIQNGVLIIHTIECDFYSLNVLKQNMNIYKVMIGYKTCL